MLAFDSLNNIAAAVNIAGRRIKHVVAVMNAAMESLLLDWDPDNIGRYPIQAEIETVVHTTVPREVKYLSGAQMHLPPIIGGFVGSDTVASLLVCRSMAIKPPYLVVDIGTNAEVALVSDSETIACSCAAGSVFEGGGIRQGMCAIEGAIYQVSLRQEQDEVNVIGGGQARGITGSGMISLMGELLRSGALDPFGLIMPEKLPDGATQNGDYGREIKLACDVSVSEQDIQQLMLAKAAARAGIELLFSECNIAPDELNSVILCGTFANSLRAEDVLSIGLVPRVDPLKILSKGNAAAEGAAMMACSHKAFEKAAYLAKKTSHLPLSGNPNFKRLFEQHVSFAS